MQFSHLQVCEADQEDKFVKQTKNKSKVKLKHAYFYFFVLQLPIKSLDNWW